MHTQGGLLGDSVSSFLAALAFSMPNTTFSQNNGVISLTRVASRMAGIGCAVWLILYGIFGKVGAFFTSIPQPVLGGMTTFLFANIAVSGVKVSPAEQHKHTTIALYLYWQA
jgi:NCS2 family nucleobase:cation symporter-2